MSDPMSNAGEFVGTTTGNPHNVSCPSCDAIICARCAVLQERLAGFCGCADCNPAQRRAEKAQAEHMTKDHVAWVADKE